MKILFLWHAKGLKSLK
ncbi:Protein of unknown function [Cotesia congregata]|uniref:Uncharacterized protein n=1 Tax=Cotesia congregata TaxID=51543 RepID=A0A8J2MWU2_COTCN|nr:Protein of unknown function [Cotesia congregata]